MSLPQNKPAQAGMTLIEVVVSVLILAVGILTVFSLLTQSVRLSAESRNKMLALNLAQQLLEEYRGSNLTLPTAVQGSVYSWPPVDVKENGQIFTYQVQVQLDPSSPPRYGDIFVQVEWQDQGQSRRIKQSTRVGSGF